MKAARLALFLAFIATPVLAQRPHAARPGIVLPPSAVDNNMSCDIGTYPAATLLLPYFEVETGRPVNDAANTIFTVINTSRLPQVARVTIWTDYGVPALWFNLFLTGYDMESMSLYDIVARGVVPRTTTGATIGRRSKTNDANPNLTGLDQCDAVPRQLDAGLRQSLELMLTHGVTSAAEDDPCHVGGDHPTMAKGYITIDVVNGCSNISPLDPAYYSKVLLFDNVLTGDFERIAADKTLGNYAGGNPMVHIKAVPEGGPAGVVAATGLPYTFYDRFTPKAARHIDRRQPLPSVFAARYIEGGTGSFQTELAIWREPQTSAAAVGCATTSAAAAVPYSSIVRYDEFENPTVGAASAHSTAVTLSQATNSNAFPPRVGASVSGWMFLDLDNHAGTTAQSPYSTTRPSQNWVTVHMRAEGRYAVDYDATALYNGCTTPAAQYGVSQ